MSDGFDGKACVMTGAGGGMGLAIACALRAEGCAVTAIDLKPKPPEFAAGEGALGRYVQGDATDEALVERTVAEAFDASGRLDYLVNAAGVGWYGRDGSIAEMEMAIWHRVMEINLTASALMARHAVPLLRRTGEGGSMVHIASVVGLRNMENILVNGPIDAYQASKAGLSALSRSLSMQLGPDGIRSNSICPGAVLTPMTAPGYEADPSSADAMIARTPLGRLGMPEDIAHACLFLLSDKASFITGIDLVVDGGIMAKL
ncbi:MAG: SDR family oxidoreductase [Rhodospirillaceae bacterium]|nr:SDR family oxidoreductase [Rhodospirillaceae bacterium]